SAMLTHSRNGGRQTPISADEPVVWSSNVTESHSMPSTPQSVDEGSQNVRQKRPAGSLEQTRETEQRFSPSSPQDSPLAAVPVSGTHAEAKLPFTAPRIEQACPSRHSGSFSTSQAGQQRFCERWQTKPARQWPSSSHSRGGW